MPGSIVENPSTTDNDAGTRDAFNFVTRPHGIPLVGFFTRNNEPLFPPVSCKQCAGMILIHLLDKYIIPDDAAMDLSRKIAFSNIRDTHDFFPEVLWLIRE